MQRVGPFLLGRTLGVGSTGKVKLGIHEKTGERVAIKIVSRDYLRSRPTLGRKVEREIAILKLIEHPNILHLHEVYETTKHLFLVLEYVSGGELFDYLVSRGRLSKDEALSFFQQIVAGIDCCHQHLICHRDLKPENLLLDAERRIKIADFGMASLIKPGSLLATSCGSPHYASPEVVMGLKYDGRPADVWSLGVILFALLTGKLPFDDENIRRLLAKVKAGVFHMPSSVPPESAELIRRMICVDTGKRITIEEIKRHQWFRSNNVVLPAFTPPFSQTQLHLPVENIMDDVLQTLTVLGLGERDHLLEALLGNTPRHEKVFYYLYLRRKQKYLEQERESRSRQGTEDGEGMEGVEGTEMEMMQPDERSGSVVITGPSPIPAMFVEAPAAASIGVEMPPSLMVSNEASVETAPIAIPGARGADDDVFMFGESFASQGGRYGALGGAAAASVGPPLGSSVAQTTLPVGTPQFHREIRQGPFPPTVPDVRSPLSPNSHSNTAASPKRLFGSPMFHDGSAGMYQGHVVHRRGDFAGGETTPADTGSSAAMGALDPSDVMRDLYAGGSPVHAMKGPPLVTIPSRRAVSELLADVQTMLGQLGARYSVDDSARPVAIVVHAQITSSKLGQLQFRVELVEEDVQNVVRIQLDSGDSGYFRYICDKITESMSSEGGVLFTAPV